MPTLAQIRTAVDNKLAALWPVVQAKQATYAANHNGRFWQGLVTRSIPPADGATALPDVGQKCPTDQPDPWPSAILTTPMEMSLVIDVYSGPLGDGYVATVQVTVLGQTYERAAQVGPETWRQYAWRAM